MIPAPPPYLDRTVGRSVFGTDSLGYDGARADYPEELFDQLAARCGGLEDRHAFEIGPGTGLASRTLLARGVASLTAIEPDPAMAEFLRSRLCDPRLRVIQRTFDAAALLNRGFDLGLAAASFHWLDADTAIAAIRRSLRPGGQWTMWWNVYRTNTELHPLAKAIRPLLAGLAQPISEGVSGHYSLDSGSHLALLRSAGFLDTDCRLIKRDRLLSAIDVRRLYASFSFIRSLPGPDGERLLDAIFETVERVFKGTVSNPILTAAYFATAPVGRGTPMMTPRSGDAV